MCVCVCVPLCLCVLKLFQSNRQRPDSEVVCDLTTHLLTEVDQVLPPISPFFLPNSVLLMVCQQETQPSPLVKSSEIFKQEVLGRESDLHSFVIEAGMT